MIPAPPCHVAKSASVPFDGPVYAGVMVVASAAMARKLGAESTQLAVPQWLVDAVDADRMAGVDAACTLAARIRDHGGFAGVHLIGVGRYRDVAARLEQQGWAKQPAPRTARTPGPGAR